MAPSLCTRIRGTRDFGDRWIVLGTEPGGGRALPVGTPKLRKPGGLSPGAPIDQQAGLRALQGSSPAWLLADSSLLLSLAVVAGGDAAIPQSVDTRGRRHGVGAQLRVLITRRKCVDADHRASAGRGRCEPVPYALQRAPFGRCRVREESRSEHCVVGESRSA